MKCNICPAFGHDHISKLCVLRHNISRGYCNRTTKKIFDELLNFTLTDSRALHGYYELPNYDKWRDEVTE